MRRAYFASRDHPNRQTLGYMFSIAWKTDSCAYRPDRRPGPASVIKHARILRADFFPWYQVQLLDCELFLCLVGLVPDNSHFLG